MNIIKNYKLSVVSAADGIVSVNGVLGGDIRSNFMCFNNLYLPTVVTFLPYDCKERGCYYQPLAAKLYSDGDKIACNSSQASLTLYKNSIVQLEIIPDTIFPFEMPQPLKQYTYNYKGQPLTMTLCKGGGYWLIVEGGGHFISLPAPYNPLSVELSCLSDNPLILAFSCTTKSSAHLTMVSYNNGFKKLFQKTASKIYFKQNAVIVNTKLKDLTEHTVVQKYVFEQGEFRLSASKLECAQNDIPQQPKLLPFVFFEALAATDYNYAKNCLTKRLQQQISNDKEFFDEFFGKIVKVVPNIYIPTKSISCAVITDADKAGAAARYYGEVYAVDTVDGRIDNFVPL